MIELSQDPQSIEFLQSKSINLHSLKNSIDRRILKITCMLKKFNKKKRKNSYSDHRQFIELYSKSIQTQPNQSEIIYKSFNQKTLCELSQQQMNNRLPSNIEKYQNKRSNTKKQSNLKERSLKKVQKQNQSVKKSEEKQIQSEHKMIESNGFTFRDVQAANQSSTDRKNIQNSQDDKFFQSLDFALQISNVQMCNSITDSQKMCKTVAISQQPQKNQALMVSSFTDLSGSQISGRRANKKIKFGGKQVILHQPVKRIIVGEQCKAKMQSEVQELYSKKRKEVCDHKMRINVLKKIQDRYGEEYSS